MKLFTDITATIPILQAGGVAVIPTDTLYGLVCSAVQPEALARLYRVRQRPATKPSITLIGDLSELARFELRPSPELQARLSELWPGPVTVIIPRPAPRWAYLAGGTGALAFRLPDKPELRAFLCATGPLLAPSANLEGQPPATTVAEAQAYFGDQIDGYVDAGRMNGRPSRIIRFDPDGTEHVLRA